MKNTLKDLVELLLVYVFLAAVLLAIFFAVSGTFWVVCKVFGLTFRWGISALLFLILLVVHGMIEEYRKRRHKK